MNRCALNNKTKKKNLYNLRCTAAVELKLNIRRKVYNLKINRKRINRFIKNRGVFHYTISLSKILYKFYPIYKIKNHQIKPMHLGFKREKQRLSQHSYKKCHYPENGVSRYFFKIFLH